MTEDAQDPYKGVKKLRKFLIVVLVLFCLFCAGYSMITLNFLRQPIEEKFQGMLKINGDIKLGVDGLRPTIVAHSVSYGKASAEKFEMRIPLAAPEAGKPIETHVVVTALALPGRPPIDIDLPGTTDKADATLDNFTARAGDSLMTGNATYKQGVLDIDTAVINLDYGLLYPGASGGAAEGRLVLHGQGDQYTIAHSLNGRLFLKGGKGRIPGRALALWNGDLMGALFAAEAEVKCAQVEFDIKNGIATAKRLVLDTGNLLVTGAGSIDFSQARMDMVFTPFKAGANTAGVPLSVSGNFGEVIAAPMEMVTLEMPLRPLPPCGAAP